MFTGLFCAAQRCSSGQFQCNNGECIPRGYVCDHDDDCGDQSDEQNCSKYITVTLMACLIGNERKYPYLLTLLWWWFFVTLFSPAYPTCRGTYFTCPSGRCIHQVWLCDGEDDCGDNADERGCGRWFSWKRKAIPQNAFLNVQNYNTSVSCDLFIISYFKYYWRFYHIYIFNSKNKHSSVFL